MLAVVRPTLECGSEVWEANKSQAAALESGGANCMLGCSSRMCNEAVRGDMGLDTLQGRRDRNKLKLAAMPGKDTQRSFLIRSGPSSHVVIGRESVGGGLLIISFQR